MMGMRLPHDQGGRVVSRPVVVSMATKSRCNAPGTWRAYIYESQRHERKQQVSITLVDISCSIGGVDDHQPGAVHRPEHACCDGAGAPVRQLRARTHKHLMTTPRRRQSADSILMLSNNTLRPVKGHIDHPIELSIIPLSVLCGHSLLSA